MSGRMRSCCGLYFSSGAFNGRPVFAKEEFSLKSSRQRSLSLRQNIFWNTAGSAIYLGCQWLITVLVVRLSSSGFTNSGLLTLAMTNTNIFYSIAIFNMRAYQVSDVLDKYKTHTYIQIRCFTSAVSLVMCAVFAAAGFDSDACSCILLYMVFKVTEAIIDIIQGVDQRAARMDISGFSMAARGVGTAAAFAAVTALTDSVHLAILAMTGVSVLVMVCYDIPQAKRFSRLWGAVDVRAMGRLLLECLPMGIASALSSSITAIPRNFLDAACGSEILGIYGALSVPTVIVQVAATYIFNPMLSVYAEYYCSRDKKSFYRLFSQTLLAIAGLSAAALAGAALLQKPLLPLILGQEIRPYIYLFLPILICTILNAAVWFLTNLLIVIRDFKTYFAGTVFAAALSWLVGRSAVNAWSMQGVNVTLFAVYAAEILIFAAALAVRLKKQFSTSRKEPCA